MSVIAKMKSVFLFQGRNPYHPRFNTSILSTCFEDFLSDYVPCGPARISRLTFQRPDLLLNEAKAGPKVYPHPSSNLLLHPTTALYNGF
jgi:hypothetical protein